MLDSTIDIISVEIIEKVLSNINSLLNDKLFILKIKKIINIIKYKRSKKNLINMKQIFNDLSDDNINHFINIFNNIEYLINDIDNNILYEKFEYITNLFDRSNYLLDEFENEYNNKILIYFIIGRIIELLFPKSIKVKIYSLLDINIINKLFNTTSARRIARIVNNLTNDKFLEIYKNNNHNKYRYISYIKKDKFNFIINNIDNNEFKLLSKVLYNYTSYNIPNKKYKSSIPLYNKIDSDNYIKYLLNNDNYTKSSHIYNIFKKAKTNIKNIINNKLLYNNTNIIIDIINNNYDYESDDDESDDNVIIINDFGYILSIDLLKYITYDNIILTINYIFDKKLLDENNKSFINKIVYNVNKKTLSTIFNNISNQTILNMFNIFTDNTITTIFNKLSPHTTIRIITIKPDLKKYITNDKIYNKLFEYKIKTIMLLKRLNLDIVSENILKFIY